MPDSGPYETPDIHKKFWFTLKDGMGTLTSAFCALLQACALTFTFLAYVLHSSMPDYTTQAELNCERYAHAFRRLSLAQRGPYPGNPPPGYLEHYKRKNKHASLPEEYAVPVAQAVQSGASTGASSTHEVGMSTTAFTTLLESNRAMMHNFLDIIKEPRGSSHAKRGVGRGHFRPLPLDGLLHSPVVSSGIASHQHFGNSLGAVLRVLKCSYKTPKSTVLGQACTSYKGGCNLRELHQENVELLKALKLLERKSSSSVFQWIIIVSVACSPSIYDLHKNFRDSFMSPCLSRSLLSEN